MTDMESLVESPATCGFVRKQISDWAVTKEKPFPYLKVGEHLAQCPACLSWATEIAYQPSDHYVDALRLRLSWVAGILGQSVLRAWASDQDLEFDIVCAQDPESVRDRVRRRLSQCESYNREMQDGVSSIRELVPDPAAGVPRKGLEPYALARYFLESALAMAPQSGQRLKLLDQLGIAEYTRAIAEQRAGRAGTADRHFERAREYYRQVMAAEDDPGSEDAGAGWRIDQVSAHLSLAQVEYVQGGQSEPALEKAVALCLDARRLVREAGLGEEKFTRILSNLMICYLRLFLDYGRADALETARRLAVETCARPAVARSFLRRWVTAGEDAELTQLLAAPRVGELTGFLNREARRVLAGEEARSGQLS
jgi:hypothetical protein